jgi:hypothetical protein
MAGTAQATDYTVGSPNDTTGAVDCTTSTNTDCTLRQAILDANANSGLDQILFKAGLTGTITFGSEPPNITGPTDITGPGADVLAVDGNGTHKIFQIDQTIPGDAVSISDLTLQNGGPGNGGAIQNFDAAVTVSNSLITSNSGVNGGGIFSSGPSLTVEGSTITDNHAAVGGSGGGIWAKEDLTLRESTVSGNTAGADGGGVYAGLSGYYLGIHHHYGPHAIVNSTIAGNTAGRDGGGVVFCGSNYAVDRLIIDSSTVTDNYAFNSLGVAGGGGVASQCGAGYVGAELQNTIVAGNGADSGDPDVNGDSPLLASFSLIGIDSGGITEGVSGSNVTGVDPLLAPIADNGGPTEKQALPVSSPAVDQGFTGATVDQRGLTRPFDVPIVTSPAGGDASDIGAFERQAGDPVVPVLTVSTAGGGAGTVTGMGIDCTGAGTDCAGAFNGGEQTLLTATPASGSLFGAWTGCDSPSGNQCTMTMSGDKSVTATFNAVPISAPPTNPASPGTTFDLKAAIKKCKKKFPKGPKRKKCIKRAKKRAGL